MSGALLLSNWRIGQTAARLLALHVGGVTGNTQCQQCNKGRDNRFVSGGRAPLLFLRHGADDIARGMSVNQGIRLDHALRQAIRVQFLIFFAEIGIF